MKRKILVIKSSVAALNADYNAMQTGIAAQLDATKFVTEIAQVGQTQFIKDGVDVYIIAEFQYKALNKNPN